MRMACVIKLELFMVTDWYANFLRLLDLPLASPNLKRSGTCLNLEKFCKLAVAMDEDTKPPLQAEPADEGYRCYFLTSKYQHAQITSTKLMLN